MQGGKQMTKKFMSMDGNTAAAHCAYAFTELSAIYPITPSSPMAEVVDQWATAGAVHGALQAGTLATTFTASQGLLLMIPNIYKMVGECLPGVIHVAARALATRALNIFGDHEDVYACRQTGACMLASHSVQEAMDLAGVAHLSAIKGSVPFLHFFDGFRTSHEIQKIEVMDTEVFKDLIDQEALAKFRKNALNPHTNPVTRGGAEDAERIIVAMGSVTEAAKETIDALVAQGEKVGMIKVHLYRPFSVKYLTAVLPKTVKKIAVLDRTKETGATGEPLYLDVLAALKDTDIEIIGGRYGMGSKDTQAYHIKGVFDHLKEEKMINGFTVGINDDVTHLSLPWDENFHIPADYTSCLFWGLGSDGTVSANKSTVKIIGDNTDMYAQAYFAYDSKKAGGVTRSHLRFGHSPIHSTYYISNADFISCSLDAYMFKYDMVKDIKEGGTFLLNTTFSKEEIVAHMPNRMKAQLAKKHAKFYIINATKIAQEIGMGRRTNTILQSAFFALNEQIMPLETAVDLMKAAAKKSYSKKGDAVVQLNYKAIDAGKDGLVEIAVDPTWADLPYNSDRKLTGDEYFDNHVAVINGLEGYDMPVSAFAGDFLLDGSIRNNVAFNEKRTIAVQVPTWHPENCIQCGICSFVCPHATIRPFLLTDEEVANAPMEFKTIQAMGKGVENLKYRIQVTPANCVGCGLCAVECPGKGGNKALEMVDINEKLDQEPLADYLFKQTEYKTEYFPTDTVKGSQFLMPYFEVSGSCPGCGETPYYKLVSQLFGKDMLVANATGCSMIYCSSTPSTPFVNDANGEGVAWANSLFEDNAEFGYGMALSQNYKEARILKAMEDNMENVEPALKDAFAKYLEVHGDREAERAIAPTIKELAAKSDIPAVKELAEVDLVSKSIWIVGGDGWAYDIGYGGLDHVLANDLNVNVLVLDTEVYSNTGGQSSKSSQAASIAKFAAGGKTTAKKDLGQIAMAYGHVYVASISMGANQRGRKL